MAGKKSFTTQQNPALAFISAQEPEGETEKKSFFPPNSAAAALEKERQHTEEKRLQIETRPLYQRKAKEKPSSAAHVKTTDAPEGFKANPLFVETKSRRMQLLVQPSLYEAIKARATAEGQSVNELVHSILEAAIKGG